MTIPLVVLGVLTLLLLLAAPVSILIAKEYERGVVFRLGLLIEIKGSGLFFTYPVLEPTAVDALADLLTYTERLDLDRHLGRSKRRLSILVATVLRMANGGMRTQIESRKDASPGVLIIG